MCAGTEKALLTRLSFVLDLGVFALWFPHRGKVPLATVNSPLDPVQPVAGSVFSSLENQT
jgi:hypothetical protein